MADTAVDQGLLAALRAGGEALDRGERGPGREIDLLREQGWLGDVGSLAPDTLCERLMALGSASLPIARLYEGHVNALWLILRNAKPEQRETINEAVRRGALLAVWGADSDQPVAIVDGPDGRCLCGSKAYASGLGDAAIAILTAKTEHGLQMVLADVRDPSRADHESWDVDGMVGSRSGLFSCDGLPAVEAQLLGAPDAMFREPDFHGGLWRLAACYAGALHRMAQLCCNAPQEGNNTAIRAARLGAMAIEAQTAELWARHAARVAEDPQSELQAAIAAALFAREATEQAAARLLHLAERSLGAGMHRRTSEAGRIARDLRFYLRQADLDGKLALATQMWTISGCECRPAPG